MRQVDHFHVLLADDEFYLRQCLQRRFQELQGEDFVVSAQAENGSEALELLDKYDIQLVITDIRMPVMDGLELTRTITARYPDVLTVLLTGYPDFEYAQKALRYGAFDYLLKPISSEDLDTVLSRCRTKLLERFELPEEENAGKSPEESVRSAIRYMHEHYMEEIDIGVLASSLGFHSAYLTRLFSRYAGETPLKYLTGIRIQEAKKLLATTDLPIAAVGTMVGYPDQFHFSKTFRKATGLNPSAFRKAEKEKGPDPM